MDVLLSIKPRFARAIFSGEKRFEFRRTIFKDKNVKKVYVYASKPIGLVIGEFEIGEVITEEPDSLWNITKNTSGISKKYFDEYFKGKQVAYAIKVSEAQEYAKPVTLMEMFNINRPPQSFMYVGAELSDDC
jgi:predicted transcriptional regulator